VALSPHLKIRPNIEPDYSLEIVLRTFRLIHRFFLLHFIISETGFCFLERSQKFGFASSEFLFLFVGGVYYILISDDIPYELL
jgi:hypothetical protein